MVKKTHFSIIIPVLNEQMALPKQLTSLRHLREQGNEVIVVDGGSQDESIKIARLYADQIIHSDAGRSNQMNKGAACAKHDWLLFLHVDTQLPGTALDSLQYVFSKPVNAWGRFDVRLTGQHFLYKVIAWLMNKRSRLTGIATGDQAIFVKKSLFNKVGGFPDIPLMEDITLSQKLKRVSIPVCLNDVVVTSHRRWHENGIFRTIFMMWSLRLQYFFGTNPVKLAERYNRAP